MKQPETYLRKISFEEARESYIMVLKNKLSFFPPLGKEFEVTQGDRTERVAVEGYSCTCRGPDYPHEHYFITWKGLRPGDRVSFTRVPKKEGKYALEVRR